jgi:hypothetical protein
MCSGRLIGFSREPNRLRRAGLWASARRSPGDWDELRKPIAERTLYRMVVR